MATLQIEIQRFSPTSSKSFETVVAAAVYAAVEHPDLNKFRRKLGSTKTYAAMEKLNREVVATIRLHGVPSHLITVRSCEKEADEGTARMLRLVIGNPLIMKQMVEHVPDAGSYAPVTILIDERSDDGRHRTHRRRCIRRALGRPAR
jgi:hypothetical protein